MELLRKFLLVFIIFYSVVTMLYAQEWIDKNKTPKVNYFADLPEAGRWVELINHIGFNPSSKINVIQFEKIFKLVLYNEFVIIEIGNIEGAKSTNLQKRLISYSYHNEITNESVYYVIYESSSPRALLTYLYNNEYIYYRYFEDRQEKYETTRKSR